jgi:TRAP-type C4-dicarboxylate transport system permease small subunit
MKRLIKILDNLDSYIAVLAIGVTIVLLSLQVFFRYVLNASLTWSEEVSRFTYVWFVYLGVSIAIRSKEHVRVVAHLKYFFPKFYQNVLVFADIIWFCYSLLLLWESIKFIKSMFQFQYLSPVLAVSMVWIYMIIPLVFILMIVRLVQVHYLEFMGKGNRKAEDSGAAL